LEGPPSERRSAVRETRSTVFSRGRGGLRIPRLLLAQFFGVGRAFANKRPCAHAKHARRQRYYEVNQKSRAHRHLVSGSAPEISRSGLAWAGEPVVLPASPGSFSTVPPLPRIYLLTQTKHCRINSF